MIKFKLGTTATPAGHQTADVCPGTRDRRHAPAGVLLRQPLGGPHRDGPAFLKRARTGSCPTLVQGSQPAGAAVDAALDRLSNVRWAT